MICLNGPTHLAVYNCPIVDKSDIIRIMTKTCYKCGIPKELTDYYRLRGACKVCRREYRNGLHLNNPIPVMLDAAKLRAKRQNVQYTITANDVVIPKVCPILGIPLAVKVGKGGAPNSPSLDKIDPELGYIPGNIQVISNLANRMKNNATLEQMIKLGKWAARELKRKV